MFITSRYLAHTLYKYPIINFPFKRTYASGFKIETAKVSSSEVNNTKRSLPWNRYMRSLGLILFGSVSGWFLNDWKKKNNDIQSFHMIRQYLEEKKQGISDNLISQDSSDVFLPKITDEIFDNTDELCVFWVSSVSELEEKKSDIEKVIAVLESLHVKPFFAYNIKTEHTMFQNNVNGGISTVLYKGQRKYSLEAISEPTEELKERFAVQMFAFKEFFNPISESESDFLPAHPLIESVSYNNFHEKVINKATKENPILLQLMEDSCFLCFLMRPLINSIAEILNQYQVCNTQYIVLFKVPITIKRLNLERNDFPKFCPVVRATPNFVFYDGSNNEEPTPPWKEFKPKDFVEKLCSQINIPEEAETKLYELVDKLQERFQKFGLLAIWTQELNNIQKLINNGTLGQTVEDIEGEEYHNIVNELIKEDVIRTDNLKDNLVFVDHLIASTENDTISLAKMCPVDISKIEGHLQLIKARLIYDSDTEDKQTPITKSDIDNSIDISISQKKVIEPEDAVSVSDK